MVFLIAYVGCIGHMELHNLQRLSMTIYWLLTYTTSKHCATTYLVYLHKNYLTSVTRLGVCGGGGAESFIKRPSL